jgi:hypothetical protein
MSSEGKTEDWCGFVSAKKGVLHVGTQSFFSTGLLHQIVHGVLHCRFRYQVYKGPKTFLGAVQKFSLSWEITFAPLNSFWT